MPIERICGQTGHGAAADAGLARLGKTYLRVALIATLVAAVLAICATGAQASIGGFSASEGTETGAGVNCTTLLDWSCLGSAQLATTIDPSGAGDLAFASGSGVQASTESNPDGWQIVPASTTTVDPKDDIQANWSYSYTDSSFANNYLGLSFDRSSGNGNADIDFELNQNLPSDVYTNSRGTPVICRKNGDVLIRFDVQSTSLTTSTVGVYKWLWSSGHAPCTAGATGSFTQLTPPSGVTLAEGAMNSGSTPNSLSTGALGSSFATATFGETAVNLTQLANVIQPTSAPCEFFNHMQLTTRSSSSSLDSSMEDFVDGGAVVVPACESSGGGSGGGGGGGGGGTCPATPAVAITSPTSASTVTTSSVALTGTSSVPNSVVTVYDGVTAIGFAQTDGSGNWSLTLNGVADGQHSYTAVVEDSTGCTGASAPAVAITVNASSGGGGAGSCSSPTSVAINSPTNGATETSNTLTLAGTSDLAQSAVTAYDGVTVAGSGQTDASGNWSLTLANVANGQHSFSVAITSSGGCTGTSPAVHTTVSAGTTAAGPGSGTDTGSGSGAGANTGTGSNTATGASNGSGLTSPWLACSSSRILSVADVYPWAGRARVTGFAPVGSVGKTVTIIAAWSHKALGKATVLGDNSFRASVALPPRALRASSRGAYLAQLGAQTSAPLAFGRRVYNTRIQIRFVKEKVTTFKIKTVNGKHKRVRVIKFISTETITFVGSVTGPLATPRQDVIIRGAPSCAAVGSGAVVARAKVNSRGRFSVTFRLPKSLRRYKVIFLRAQSIGLQASVHAGKGHRIALFGITRGVHIF